MSKDPSGQITAQPLTIRRTPHKLRATVTLVANVSSSGCAHRPLSSCKSANAAVSVTCAEWWCESVWHEVLGRTSMHLRLPAGRGGWRRAPAHTDNVETHCGPGSAAREAESPGCVSHWRAHYLCARKRVSGQMRNTASVKCRHELTTFYGRNDESRHDTLRQSTLSYPPTLTAQRCEQA